MENKDIYFLYKPIHIPNIGMVHPNQNQLSDDIKLSLYYVPEYGIHVGSCKNINSLFEIKEYLLEIIDEKIFEGIKLFHVDKKLNIIKKQKEYSDRFRILNLSFTYENLNKDDIKLKNKAIMILNKAHKKHLVNNNIINIFNNINKQLEIILNKTKLDNGTKKELEKLNKETEKLINLGGY